MKATRLKYGEVIEDQSGLLHYKSYSRQRIFLAAEEALAQRVPNRPIWFWYEEYFCPITDSNCIPFKLTKDLTRWRSKFESSPRKLLELLSITEPKEILVKDTCGIWHYRPPKSTGMSLKIAAENAVTEPGDPEDVTFFWFDDFVCPIKHKDTGEKLVSRWTDWKRGYDNYSANILWFFQNLF